MRGRLAARRYNMVGERRFWLSEVVSGTPFLIFDMEMIFDIIYPEV